MNDLIPRLMQIQRALGYLDKDRLNLLSEELGIPKSQVWDVAGYFPSFRHKPGPDVTIGVCRDMTCHLRGAVGLLRELRALTRENSPRTVSLETVSCLGRCDHAPIVQLSRNAGGAGHPLYLDSRSWATCPGSRSDLIRDLIDDKPTAATTTTGHSREPSDGQAAWSIDVYDPRTAAPGQTPEAPYSALKALAAGGRGSDLIKALSDATLVGLGGGARANR